MSLCIQQVDITSLPVDAIVNAANTELLMGGGVCGAIFRAAGADQLQEACRALAPIRTGEAVITPGFNLSARYIIHTAGPIWHGGTMNEQQLLQNSYVNSLLLASEHGCKSIAFPLISSGIYGYPKEEAMRVAADAINGFLSEQEMDVTIAVLGYHVYQLGKKYFY